MQYPLLAALPPPLVVSYLIPFLIWCNILPLLPCIPLWSFLIEFLFKYDAISCPGCLTYRLPWWFRIEFLFKYDAISSPCCLASSCGRFLLNPYSNMMRYPLLAALPPPVVVFYWIPIQIWCNILSWRPYLLLWSFLIEVLFKYNAISSPGCLASSSLWFLLNSNSCKAARRGYCIIFEQEFNKKRPREEARQPGVETASYLNRNSIRNSHGRRQGSHERILHYIWIGIQ